MTFKRSSERLEENVYPMDSYQYDDHSLCERKWTIATE